MSRLSRRNLLTATGAGGLTVLAGAGTPARAAERTTPSSSCVPEPGAATVTPTDARYPDLVRGWNGRFVGSPDQVRVVHNTAQVQDAVADALRANLRPAVRSGGHCVENFVTDPRVQVVIDMSQLTDVYYDNDRRAFVVESGATLRDVYRKLYTGWGVTVPGGTCPSVGAGGHFAGGGFGALARLQGIVPDHIYAVEVVTVNSSGTVCTVVATREPRDPNRELWWAHTGGGGGNFGVVTRYWMRSWDATGTDPRKQLPAPPRQSRVIKYIFPWPTLNEAAFIRLVTNYITWHERNSAPDSPAIRLSANLTAVHVNTYPGILMTVTVDPTDPATAALVAGFRAEVVDAAGAPVQVIERTYPWLQSTNAAGFGDTGDIVGRRSKAKGAYLRRSYTPEQIATTYRYLTTPNITAPLAGVLFSAYGGRANALPADATAVPQRDSVLKALHTVHWDDPAQDEQALTWVRDFYRDVYASTGGVPALNTATDGTFINYADVDLRDPAHNTSGVPWSALYYKDSYARLQQVKAQWDPRNIFHHGLSVELPS